MCDAKFFFTSAGLAGYTDCTHLCMLIRNSPSHSCSPFYLFPLSGFPVIVLFHKRVFTCSLKCFIAHHCALPCQLFIKHHISSLCVPLQTYLQTLPQYPIIDGTAGHYCLLETFFWTLKKAGENHKRKHKREEQKELYFMTPLHNVPFPLLPFIVITFSRSSPLP